MRPARGEYPCGRNGCTYVAMSPGQLGGHRTTHHARKDSPRCESGCGAAAEIDDNRGRWWCVECFFDPAAKPDPSQNARGES